MEFREVKERSKAVAAKRRDKPKGGGKASVPKHVFSK